MKADQDIIRTKLRETLDKIQLNNPAFSLRAFASKLDVSPGNLSQFLTGKRAFSAETLEMIVTKLNISPEERKDLLNHLNVYLIERLQEKIKTSEYDSKTLGNEEFLELNEWYYYALRSLMSLNGYKLNIPGLARSLGLTVDQVESAIEKMVVMKVIEILPDMSVRRTSKVLKTPDNQKDNIRAIETGLKIHKHSLEHATYSLENHSRDLRDITWVNIPSNSKKLEKARELIRKFQDDMIALLEDGEQDKAMRLTIQLCPIERGP